MFRRIVISLTPAELDVIKDLASQEVRTTHDQIRFLIIQGLGQAGARPPATPSESEDAKERKP